MPKQSATKASAKKITFTKKATPPPEEEEVVSDTASETGSESSEGSPAPAKVMTAEDFMAMGLPKIQAEAMALALQSKFKEADDAKTYEELKVKHGITKMEALRADCVAEYDAKLEAFDKEIAEALKHADFAEVAPAVAKTKTRKATAPGDLSDGMKSFIRRLEARAPLGSVNAHDQGHKCLSCSKFYIGRDSKAWTKHKATCEDVKAHKPIWVQCVKARTDTKEMRLSWRPS